MRQVRAAVAPPLGRAPRIAWQASQPTRGTAPGRALPASSSGAGGRALPGARSQASKSRRGSTTTCSAIRACCSPQNSAHWPRCRPGAARRVRGDGPPRDHVDLAGERRHPEAVDHVADVKAEPDRPSGRQSQFVGGDDSAPRATGSRHSASPTTTSVRRVTPTIGGVRRPSAPNRRRAPCDIAGTGDEDNQWQGDAAADDPAPREAPRPRRLHPSRCQRQRPTGLQRHRRDERPAPRRRYSPSAIGRSDLGQRRAWPRRRIEHRPDRRSFERTEVGGHSRASSFETPRSGIGVPGTRAAGR